MVKKLQIFVSSTYTDLIDERQAAVEAILDAGHIPAGMELFKAGKSQMETIRKWIDESDVYMLILGGRYGSIEEESGLSYTELEYRYALSKAMPVFAIVLDDSFLFTKAASKGKDAIFEKDNIDKYENFKKYVKTKIVSSPQNIDQITSIIHSHLNGILNNSDYKLIGWIRTDSKNDLDKLLKENDSLKKEINVLREQTILKKEELFGNYSFTELVTLFKAKLFTVESNKLLRIKEGGIINALELFILYYDYFVTGVPNRLFCGEYYYLYNYIIPYYVGFQLMEQEKSKSKFQITKMGCSFYTMLEMKGIIKNQNNKEIKS